MGFMNILTFFGRKKLAKLYSSVRKLFFGRNGEAVTAVICNLVFFFFFVTFSHCYNIIFEQTHCAKSD